MAQTRFTVVGPSPAYGARPGDSVTLDDNDPLVQINVSNGVIAVAGDQPATEKVACEACVGEGKQRPPKFDTHDELVKHYREKHPALAPPTKEGE